MVESLQDLAVRVAALEKDVASLKSLTAPSATDDTPARRGRRLLEQAERDAEQFRAHTNAVFEKMGITGKAMPPEELRRLLIAHGAKPEQNLMSRGIIEMRG